MDKETWTRLKVGAAAYGIGAIIGLIVVLV